MTTLTVTPETARRLSGAHRTVSVVSVNQGSEPKWKNAAAAAQALDLAPKRIHTIAITAPSRLKHRSSAVFR